ncbi:DegV domain-containing protein YitS [Jeotgalicoccus coquinae]|uniref:DegV domain-containing protein n=1 Tax=Jeotgalicoccus coquinae TaxID=709509 RepID=A0A6V7RMD3_9STAP|nr:DegV family protein [Jeotgalicoccus coquinae]MBB6422388.1 DegV family protein with EDD domain [Jeotgalicoccus coquinae]GGE16201.1 DegV domain-containing protein YitS [Jeotgalicoccus coquinae]CAD2078738.1 DegV domain-containing protein [Jeotgalicoccus coquinae]
MKLIIDSCADISQERARELNADMQPLTIQIDDKSYIDQFEITSEEVIQSIKDGRRPMTSQPNPESFAGIFKKYAEQNESIIYLGLSSALSGTYQSAVIARDTLLEEYPDADITLIDTSAVSYGLGLIVERAAGYIAQGDSKETVISKVEQDISKIRHLFTVNDLNYLAEGGRLSKGSAFLGGLLNIKPLLHVEDGKLVPLEKHRGLKKVFKRMNELAIAEGASGTGHIVHADAEKLAADLKDQLLKNTDLETINITGIGPTISSHTGDGTIALFYFKDGE